MYPTINLPKILWSPTDEKVSFGMMEKQSHRKENKTREAVLQQEPVSICIKSTTTTTSDSIDELKTNHESNA